MLRRVTTKSVFVANVLFLLCIGCAYQPPPSSSSAAIWMTYARNVPHATQQRVDMFSSSEDVAIVVKGLPAQWVTVSMHDAPTGKLIGQQTHYIPARSGSAISLKPMRPGLYIVRASQEGVLKAESQFSIRD